MTAGSTPITAIASLRLYADDTTTYSSSTNTTALELSFNQDLQKLSTWFSQAMILGNLTTNNLCLVFATIIEIESFQEILGVHIDNKFSFKAYVSAILKKVYAKIGALRRLKRLVPCDINFIQVLYFTPSGIIQSPFIRNEQNPSQ